MTKDNDMTKEIQTTSTAVTGVVMETVDEAIKRIAEPRVINADDFPSTPMYEKIMKDHRYEIRINELEARVDFIESHIALLMKDREASIRLLHGRMNNEVGLQKLINGWKDEV